MPISDDLKDRVLAKTPLAALIGESVSLQRKASQLTGCCPFHEEHTPSFYVYEDHYHCFGCGAHGDAISFVTQRQGLKFFEALEWLANKYSIPLPESENLEQRRKDWKKRSGYQLLMKSADEFFRKQLSELKGEKARSYLELRGFHAEDVQRFGFGYAPAGGTQLLLHLQQEGFSKEDVSQCSLANLYSHKAYDFFQNRLMLPIHDPQGRLIAFAGRALEEGEPQKYKNSRYDKASILFGFDRAQKGMLRTGRALVVEGYMDAIQLWRQGFEEAVACQGTALTQSHLDRLSHTVKSVYLLFDGDEAGLKAVLRTFELSFSFPHLFFKVLRLPEGEDPDSFLKKEGADALRALIDSAVDLFDFVITHKLKKAPSTGVPELVRSEFFPLLAQMKDPLRQNYLMQQIAMKTGIELPLLRRQLQSSKRKHSKESSGDAQDLVEEDAIQEDSFLGPLEKEVLGQIYYAEPQVLNIEDLESFLFSDLKLRGEWREWAKELLESLRVGDVSPSQKPISDWVSAYASNVESLIREFQDRASAFTNEDKKGAIAKLRSELRRKQLRELLSSLKKQVLLMDHGSSVEPELWQQMGQQLSKVSQELNQVEQSLRPQ
ncbi:MAG: DNA primase [Oligoflexales bacterium]|nr:DNA primase [Oligoflexales bacterium]